MAGTPTSQRRLEADRQRVQDLVAIAEAVREWSTTNTAHSIKGLPANLNVLFGHGVNSTHTADIETKVPYEFRALSDSTYELCANFSEPSEAELDARSNAWHHGKGHTCFTLAAAAANVPQ